MLVEEKIKRADSGGIGALSISSVEAALAPSLLSEKKKQANKLSTILKKSTIHRKRTSKQEPEIKSHCLRQACHVQIVQQTGLQCHCVTMSAEVTEN